MNDDPISRDGAAGAAGRGATAAAATAAGPGTPATAAGPGTPAPGAAASAAAADGAGWPERLRAAAAFVRRQLAGEGEPDPDSGFDPEFNSAILLPAARLLYRNWFRVQLHGTERVPGSGAALIVANHSGVLPLDALMLQVGLHDEHPAHRHVRWLSADLVYSVPGLGSLARKSGHVPASRANAAQLLRAGHLVGVFPEGFKGIGKPFAQRYQLQRFGRGGFAAMAIAEQVPIVPCAIVGAEEIYPMVADWATLARALRLPYFPVTPLFPWLGPVGMVPLPSRWVIGFGEPVVPPAARRDDERQVSRLAGKVKRAIAAQLRVLLAARGDAFGELPAGAASEPGGGGAPQQPPPSRPPQPPPPRRPAARSPLPGDLSGNHAPASRASSPRSGARRPD
jgi:1-acyl-sn-glycerol-3-phosphate acyltransferase